MQQQEEDECNDITEGADEDDGGSDNDNDSDGEEDEDEGDRVDEDVLIRGSVPSTLLPLLSCGGRLLGRRRGGE